MTGAESAEVAASIVNAVAALVVAGAAIWGLTTWRRELTGKRRAELAEEILVLFYEARSKLSDARSGRRDRADAQNVAPPDDQKRDVRHGHFAPADILEEQGEFWSKFLAARFRFTAVFGKAHETHFGTMNGCRTRVIMAANLLSSAFAQLSAEERGSFSRDLWYGGKDDEIAIKADAAVEAIERICGPAIEARSNW